MAVLITLIVVLILAVAYPVIGWRWAVRDLPRVWTEVRRVWPAGGEYYIRRCVKIETMKTITLWPLYGLYKLIYTCTGWLSGRLGQVIDAGDPLQEARRIESRDRTDLRLSDEPDYGGPDGHADMGVL